MAKYAQLFDVNDPVLQVTESDLQQADAWLDGQLRARGISPDEVDPTHPLLKNLALYQAYIIAATCGKASDEEGVMDAKVRYYSELAKGLLMVLSREALGLQATRGSYGTVQIGRG